MAIARERMAEEPRIGGKKTAFVMITVVGCIAILWPKIISPMFATAPRSAFVGRDPYSPGAGGGKYHNLQKSFLFTDDFVLG